MNQSYYDELSRQISKLAGDVLELRRKLDLVVKAVETLRVEEIERNYRVLDIRDHQGA